MATTSGVPPGGFSYAQAARGQQTRSTAQSSLETSNSESTKDWADDVESSMKSKTREGGDELQETSSMVQEAKSGLDRAKSENKLPVQSSGIPSPDIAGSATSHDDASSTAQNGTSVSSWENKSQSSETVVTSSEPAWIAERKERQGTTKNDVPNAKGNNTTIMPEQKPVVLHEAAPPAVNPWAKRIEDAKAKTVTPPVAKSAASAETPRPTQQPQEAKSSWQKPIVNAQSPKDTRPVDNAKGHRATKSLAALPPSVKDQTSWPTPEIKQETEKRPSVTHTTSEDKIDEEAASGKPRKKQEWKPVPVVPNIIWETPGINPRASRSSPNGERAPRGGASARGRGGARGASNAVYGDRAAQSTDANSTETAARESSSTRDVDHDTKSKSTRKTGLVNGTRDSPSPEKHSQQSSPEMLVETDVKQNAAPASVNGVEPHSETSTPIEARKDSSTREWPSARGGARRGRGRGGRGDLTNGHNYNYVNGHGGQEYNGQFVSSPTFLRGGYSNVNRAGYRANSNRAQSLPFDPAMLRYGPFVSQPPFSPLQPYSPMTDYSAYGMMAPQPYVDYGIIGTVIAQLDYYFSIDNLVKDTFLRKNMDSQGFVLLEVIAAFNRLKQLTTDVNMIKMASSSSEIVEIVIGDDGQERLRKAKEWEQWVLPMEERFQATRNAGPQSYEQVQNPFQPQMPPRHHMSLPFINGPRPGDRRSYDFTHAMSHQMSPHAMYAPEFQQGAYSNMNGSDEVRGRHAKSAGKTNDNSEGQSPAAPSTSEDADVFPDDKIEQLTVCVILSKETAPQYNASSRTFSNGSIDAKVVEKEAKTETVNGDKPVGKVNGETTSEAQPTNAQDLSVFWIKDNDAPASSLPSNLTPEPYSQLREKAIGQRNAASTGNCPYDMEVLYQFWSHFLIRNFNNTMYSDFVRLALDDNTTRYSPVGHRNLAKYYDQAINSAHLIPLRVARDYIALAKEEGATNKDDSIVFKNLHRSWRNGALNLRNRKRVTDVLDNELKQLLEG